MKKVIRLSLLVFLVSSIFLLVGCNKPAQPPLPESKQSETTTPEKTPVKTPEPEPAKEVVPAVKLGDFFPVVAGSTWEYQGAGNEYASFSRKILFAIWLDILLPSFINFFKRIPSAQETIPLEVRSCNSTSLKDIVLSHFAHY